MPQARTSTISPRARTASPVVGGRSGLVSMPSSQTIPAGTPIGLLLLFTYAVDTTMPLSGNYVPRARTASL